MKIKKRLDAYLQEKYPHYSRTQLQSWIMQGMVTVNGQKSSKSGTFVCETDDVNLVIGEQPKFVCRAGYKLEHALIHFAIDPSGLIALDAGLSTGGFTDCLLQFGAAKIYGIDVGYGQVHEKIRKNPAVIIKERTNLRYLDDLGELVDLVTLDLSFISLLKVMDAVNKLLKPGGQLITLIKPQFEAERHEVGRGGIIYDQAVHQRVVETVGIAVQDYGYTLVGTTPSPITGSDGNKEFLAYFKKQ
jgi:23S rRNA (cytidine1920-2'-O)/16S rRNA (cytidine1409-2'-O)-methyltransferase